MVRIRVEFKKKTYGVPKTVFPVNFFVDVKNDEIELRSISVDDAKNLFHYMSDDTRKNTKVREKSSYGGGLDLIIPFEFVESVLTFTNA